jgi:tetratricopeptide (TPR) repeat protein
MTGTQAERQKNELRGEQAAPAQEALGLSRFQLLSVVLGLVALVYLPALGYGFTYDDHSQIERNPRIQSWEHVGRYFTEHVWAHQRPGAQGEYYRPLFLLWLRVNHALAGLAPAAWHFLALLLHLLCVALVFLLAARTLRDDVPAAAAALLFGVHPAQMESVVWISGATEPLQAAFLLGALLACMHWKASGSSAWLGASLALFACALLSKETAAILPGLIFVWIAAGRDAEPGPSPALPERLRSGVAAALPFVAVLLLYLPVRAAALGGSAMRATLDSLLTALYTAPSLLWFYFTHLVWPAGLAVFYDTPYVTAPGARNVLLPLAGAIGALALLGWLARRRRGNALFAALILLPLVPPLVGVAIFEDADLAHDRYLYLPVAGLALLAAGALGQLGAKARMGAAGGLILALALLNLAQAGQWRDDITLYTRGVRYAPRSALARNRLATEFFRQGRVDDALRIYSESLALEPDNWKTNFVLGVTLYSLKRWDEAEIFFERTIQIDPRNGNQYALLAESQLHMAKLDAAEATLELALARDPRSAEFHFWRGVVFEKRGDLRAAREEYHTALAQNPAHSGARARLAGLNSAAPAPPPAGAGRRKE